MCIRDRYGAGDFTECRAPHGRVHTGLKQRGVRLANDAGQTFQHRLVLGHVRFGPGGGNLFRGAGLARAGMDRVTGDHMGMLATVMNSLALQDALESMSVATRVMSAVRINQVCEDYIRRRAVRHLEKGRVIIFAAGTGNPFFTTDTAASLRAIEIEADLLLKATKVDGIYDADPMLNPSAKRYDRLTYDQVLDQRLNVMDQTSIVLCRDHPLPLRVFNLNDPGARGRAATGGDVGTLVTN